MRSDGAAAPTKAKLQEEPKTNAFALSTFLCSCLQKLWKSTVDTSYFSNFLFFSARITIIVMRYYLLN